MKLYVWDDVFWNEGPGKAFAYAESKEEARELLIQLKEAEATDRVEWAKAQLAKPSDEREAYAKDEFLQEIIADAEQTKAWERDIMEQTLDEAEAAGHFTCYETPYACYYWG